MTAPADFEDRLAARLLDVDVDADPAVVRAQFRRLARAVHPDTAVGVGCVDLGRLAAAKQRLIARAEGRSRDRARLLEQERARRADAARERLLRVRREQAARQRLERMRLVGEAPAPFATARGTTAAAPRRRSASAGRLGLLVDLAG